MTDTLSPAERGERMSRVRGRDTEPELLVRRLLHGMGYRYRLQARDLPSRPDVVFRHRKKAVFVHGCFWHRHPDPACKLARLPKSRLDFWLPKLNDRCAVTGTRIINGGGRSEVRAAHIRPVDDDGPDIVRNGIALSATVHRLFDRHLISISEIMSCSLRTIACRASCAAFFARENTAYIFRVTPRFGRIRAIAYHRDKFVSATHP